jgi:CHAT domain-containing protein
LLSEAITLLDDLRSPDLSDADKVSIFDTQQRTFQLLQQALVAQGKEADALTIAERGRAQAFVELLAEQLAAEDTALDPPNLAAIQALAQQQQTTLVEYSIASIRELGEVLYIWVISPDGTIAFRQQSLTDIDLTTLVTDTRQSIGVRSADRASAIPTLNPEYLAQRRADTDQKLTDLHDLLIAPIADLLPTDPNQPVVFIPQGELFLVPFPALKDPNGEYLIENHTLLTAPSIQVLQLTRDLADQSPLLSGVEGRGARGRGSAKPPDRRRPHHAHRHLPLRSGQL